MMKLDPAETENIGLVADAFLRGRGGETVDDSRLWYVPLDQELQETKAAGIRLYRRSGTIAWLGKLLRESHQPGGKAILPPGKY